MNEYIGLKYFQACILCNLLGRGVKKICAIVIFFLGCSVTLFSINGAKIFDYVVHIVIGNKMNRSEHIYCQFIQILYIF